MERVNCCRAFAPEERPLCRVRESEAFRFKWSSSFDGNAVVYIGLRSGRAVLHWEHWPTKAPRNLILPAAGWHRLQDAIGAAGFWSLPPHDETLVGFDGATWTVEGRRGSDYHAIERWSPGGPIYALGRAFFELAGSPLAEIELY